jgi:hypothetical protein
MFTVITIKPPQGASAPSHVQLRGRTVCPDAQGHVTLSSYEAIGLIRAGWQVVESVDGAQVPLARERANI